MIKMVPEELCLERESVWELIFLLIEHCYTLLRPSAMLSNREHFPFPATTIQSERLDIRRTRDDQRRKIWGERSQRHSPLTLRVK